MTRRDLAIAIANALGQKDVGKVEKTANRVFGVIVEGGDGERGNFGNNRISGLMSGNGNDYFTYRDFQRAFEKNPEVMEDICRDP